MKNFFLILLLLAGTSIGFSQNQASSFTGDKSDQPRDPRNDLMNFVPNEVLVKFKDAVPVTVGARVKVAGVSSVDKILAAHGVTELEKLFPTEQKPARVRMMKSPQGKVIAIPRIDNIYRVNIPALKASGSQPTNIHALIEELKALPEVEYAEPNYIYSVDKMQPTGSVLTAEDVKKLQSNSTQTAFTPNDPLYGQQWYIHAVKADSVWQQTTGDTTQVIAILDTGVDWTHPDLKNKIWKNPNPATAWNMDGILNDIRGWDFINSDNNPMDDNSHGTHVAGIAAAETNNGIGIAGVCPNAKIMPIKVFQSSGRGDAATITKGIIYAATHGATVINMSFGSYARSLAMEEALANAYATCVLVAAAGNDDIDIEDRVRLGRFYPAALSYVLGVMAPEAKFSNKDGNGPTFSTYAELNNYEIKAPGTNILSTIPDGNYRIYQGTSMAAPIVSGIVALYRSKNQTDSQEMLFGNLINSTVDNVDIQKALTIIPTPQLSVVNYQLADTINGDWDWKADAGETIQLNVNIRNTWGQADSVYVGVKFQEFEDTTTALIEKGTSYVGTIGSYATLSNLKDLLRIKIQPNVTHNRDIQFILQTWKGMKKEYLSEQKITICVEHGTELKGVIEDTVRLTPDKYWLISNSLKISPSGVIIIEPGTTLRIDKRVSLGGKIIANGTEDKHIKIESTSGIQGGVGEFKYTDFIFINSDNSFFDSHFGIFKNCLFEGSLNNMISQFSQMEFYDCVFRNMNPGCLFFTSGGTHFITNRCNFHNIHNSIRGLGHLFETYIIGQFTENNFANCGPTLFIYDNEKSVVKSNNFLGNTIIESASGFSYDFSGNYIGTLDSLKIEDKLIHFWDVSSLAILKYQPMLTKPTSKAHACVWKVAVNGKDAQDDFKAMNPLGVGKQKFEVFFNRPMNIKISPVVSMGVRDPYNQVSINENGSWSADSLIYTVYKNISLTVNNGLNRIKVVNGKDTEGFDLVPESERFNVNIQTTTSSSLEFMATAGLGKVKLEWNNSDLADGLGYNMYRMEHINDSTLTKPVLINKTLITDTLYTDFAVTPNKKYYYYYKILRTNMAETDSSKFVSAIPFTASKGDANGDLSVNVLDITSIVAYLLNNNPQPFIFEAADVNSDTKVNVLDIVGVVNKVLGAQKVRGVEMTKQADLYMKNDTLFADVTVPVGGIQLDLKGISSTADIQKLQALEGFESGYNMNGDSLRLIYYSMSGKSIPAGQHIPLLKLKNGSTITNAVFGEPTGSPIHVNFILTRVGDIQNNMNQTVAELGQNYPNPVTGKTIIPIRIYEPVEEATLRIVNTIGQQVGVITLTNPYIGEHFLPWTSGQNKGLLIYTLEIKNGTQRKICPLKKMIVQ